MKKQTNWPTDFLTTTNKKGVDVNEYYKGKLIQLIADGFKDFQDAKPVVDQWRTTLTPETYIDSYDIVLESTKEIDEADIEEHEVRVFSTTVQDEFNGNTPSKDLREVEQILKKGGYKKAHMLRQSAGKDIKISYATRTRLVSIIQNDDCWHLHVRSL